MARAEVAAAVVESAFLHQFTMVYRVKRVTPTDLSDENFDAVVEVEWAAGPAQAGFQDAPG